MGENREEIRERISGYAIENFKNGLNCSECVLEAFIRAGVLSLPPEAVALATGFGGGLGLSGYTCGALSAAVLVNSAVHGRTNPYGVPAEQRGREVAEKHYRRYNCLVHDFRLAHGGVLCREISAPFDDWHSKERRKTCLKLIGAAAALAYDYLSMPQEEAFVLPYGPNMGGEA